jgi:MFS family permease
MNLEELQSKHSGLEPPSHSALPVSLQNPPRTKINNTDPNLVFQPVFSSLSDLFGRKPLVLVTIAWFTIGAIVAGVANNFTHMLIGRSLQGIGGGGIITLTGILIADIVPLSERPKYFGMLSGIWSLGTVTGPVIGGCFAEKVTWVRMKLSTF